MMDYIPVPVYHDQTLECVDCGTRFIFEAGEQAFFFGKRPPLAPPKRCPKCRAYRKATICPQGSGGRQ